MPIEITLPELEAFDDRTQTFLSFPEETFTLEHSLISLARWESKWHKFFLSDREKTDKETLSYIQCMGVDGEIPEESLNRLTQEDLDRLVKYINDAMTATTFAEFGDKKPSREQVSNELIYYWMHSMGIDKTCETWHLARLITLIRLTSEKNKPAKKMTRQDTAQHYRNINERNKALFKTPS